ncbi:MAG: prolyl oligopeptidase family serine peptidase [Ignavibacteria bacterium]|nr:prolyl oligopeptidase family serine peptidase [Ignavibacteria bacterium]MBT8381086.1 prolyl oligopeptidase family serine peptidase [Ignavibacteria bacterium]MBT8391915.1 prolyl oligopeptidase family serine peptidase [Ignavibacteria bacterium]NNJ53635.1 S9 family peptidase [Ignavibacteriaceae bacterium]NNL19984.1 S9 family peptidase [Ignavibacteriaceae bacterium]
MKNLVPLFILLITFSLHPQTDTTLSQQIESLKKYNENLEHRLDVLEKTIDDVLWFQRVGDAAFIDKVYMTGPPKWKELNPTGQGAGNPVKFWSYVFIPKDLDYNNKYPLIVLPHGGVHSNFSTYYTHIIRELMAQQYIVVAAEYRGSTGYGKSHYQKIDYGGLEYEDVDSSRKYMLDNYEFIDPERVGIIGWSHGGLITLMNIFNHPENYKVAFAGVPVSDLIARMGYKDQNYRDLYEVEYHIGQSAEENVEEYKRRSPVWNVDKFENTPLLIHTNTNDEDVNVLEVEALIRALEAADKNFEYEIFEDMPGGHSFDRQDTKLAVSIRLKIYNFLENYLNPPNPFKSVEDLRNRIYR